MRASSVCGSRAGAARSDELTTAQCLDVVDELAALGTRHVVLIGGEAYLREDFAQIIAAITRAGDGLHDADRRPQPVAGTHPRAVETSAGEPMDVRVPVDLTPRADGVSTTKLDVCYGCFRHLFAGTITCPFCAQDVAAARAAYETVLGEAREAQAKLTSLLTAR